MENVAGRVTGGRLRTMNGGWQSPMNGGWQSRMVLGMLLGVLAPRAGAWTITGGNRVEPRGLPKGVAARAPQVGLASILDLALAEQWCSDRGLKPAHLQTVYRTLFRRGQALDSAVLAEAGVPRQGALDLVAEFTECAARVVEIRESAGGGRKLLVELGSGALVETVLIRHKRRTSGRARHTVCVSSQAGCSRRCTFCATGSMGLLAQLSTADIVEQVWLALRLIADDALAGGEPAPLRNVVFMGMGEPLDNFESVLGAIRALSHTCLFSLSPRQLTVSTVGASADKIRRLAHAAPAVRLALSLHAATQPLRAVLVPSAAECELPELADALDEHARVSGCGAMIEYLLISGMNDSSEDAKELAAFCHARRKATPGATPPFVNLIPYNPTEPGALAGFHTPSDEAVATFHAQLRANSVNALIRWTSAAGRDADGGCGQLVLGSSKRTEAAHPFLTGGRASVSMALPGGSGERGRDARRMLEGVKLSAMLEELLERVGWQMIADETGARCLDPEARPHIKSALKFLRAPGSKWARERLEALWLEMKLADTKEDRAAVPWQREASSPPPAALKVDSLVVE
mmetsp:Transcript_48666/g.111671  ORF Transcript_48666/g.111671 Transcript_48666/m.111671 type:complete len:577 (+) Transcript_48666:27-1757(+)|eukprot:CAMPEP_0179855204 /NCGR_PEP_ID=MMETSP0982-20121206/10386_1 /TAXON_ID=483367 /ORGANISM="non described non described, Strain CCMP 2436" /LENGTH=576 /DNA_ID=CAMNT_0021741229 /DNA_START=968 /DNA_END=2698 /DNA_ORIENTATION=-